MKNTKQIARTINNVIFAPIVLIIIIFLNSFSFNTTVASIITIVSLVALLALGYIELLIQKKPFVGQPTWFTRVARDQRLIIPKTWQGWLYATIIIAIFLGTFIFILPIYFQHAPTLLNGFIIRLSVLLLLLIDVYRISHNVSHSVSKKNGKKKQ